MNDQYRGAEISERLVGFDARTIVVPDWLQKRRDQYLLRPEVEYPYSADEMVWPSVFDQPSTLGNESSASPVRPTWIGRNSPLWDDLGALVASLNEAWGMTWNPCLLMAVSVRIGLCPEAERNEWEERVEATTPSVVFKEWTLIGYDVCDKWVLSGLMNCGYMPYQEDVLALQNRWAPHLNDHHLFADPKQADEFRLLSNQRVEEHAPFFVFGIYTIPMDSVKEIGKKRPPIL